MDAYDRDCTAYCDHTRSDAGTTANLLDTDVAGTGAHMAQPTTRIGNCFRAGMPREVVLLYADRSKVASQLGAVHS